MAEISLHIVARMADYMETRPYRYFPLLAHLMFGTPATGYEILCADVETAEGTYGLCPDNP